MAFVTQRLTAPSPRQQPFLPPSTQIMPNTLTRHLQLPPAQHTQHVSRSAAVPPSPLTTRAPDSALRPLQPYDLLRPTQSVQPRRRIAASASAASTTSATTPGGNQGLEAARGAQASAAPQVLAGKTVGIVGGGPGGMLCAAHLAWLGAAVEVFERHDPAAVDTSKPPPAVWSIALGVSAKRAIEAAGLSSDFGPQWQCVLP